MQLIDLTQTDYSFLSRLTPSGYVKTGINLLFGISGVAAFIFLLIGGFKWVVAGSDKDALDKAKKTITQALIGLAVVFSAYALIFIIQALFSVNLLQFNLRGIGT